MSEFKKTILLLDKRYDSKAKRHYLNGETTVLHCHHYAALYSQLAIDANETKLLAEVAEETFYRLLINYFDEYDLENIEERISIAEQYYAALGLGCMNVIFAGEDSGQVDIEISHIDAGWKRKWGAYDKPVNYISSGYISGMFAAIFDKELHSYNTNEIKSIVKGDKSSIFKVYHN
jgi:hypothetical protein